MGTNYYLKPLISADEMEVLKKFNAKVEGLHIGKSSYGWSFSFHAVDKYEVEIFTELLPLSEPLTDNIDSEDDWRVWIDYKCQIYDECEREIDPKEFWDMVDSKRDGMNHHDYMLNESKFGNFDNSFKDHKGNSFSKGEFC